MAGVLDLKLLKKNPVAAAAARRQKCGKSMGAEQGEGRAARAAARRRGRANAFGGCVRVRRAGARAGAADMPVECRGLCVVRTVLHVQCSPPFVRACCLGNAGRRAANGHARRGARVRVLQSMVPLGAAQTLPVHLRCQFGLGSSTGSASLG
eukprot:1643968-Prymnesium_polylepis.1